METRILRNSKGQFKTGTRNPWNKGVKCPWTSKRLKGTHLSETTKQKMSVIHKNKPNKGWFKKGTRSSTQFKQNDPRLMGHYNSSWKGGITSKDVLERKRFRKTMQALVFQRDNYTCQLCGNNQDLQVDHIQSWADYVELRFTMDNCRTLCASCHYLITFGKPMPATIKGWGHNLARRVQS